MTDMRPHAQRFLHHGATVGALLTGVVRWYCNDRDVMQEAVVSKPVQEDAPANVMNAFCQFAVVYHVADLKVLIGNQVVRRDQRVCLFTGKIFTLPLNLQMLLGKSFSCFLAIGRLHLFARMSSLESFESLFSFAVVSWVRYRVALGVGQEGFESHIDANFSSRWNVFDFALSLDAKLDIVPIGASDNVNPLDVFDGEGFNVLLLISD